MTTVVGFPLSPQQERAWEALRQSSAAWSSVSVRIDGSIDADRLKASLEQVIARHEILRTTFVQPSGRRVPLQVVGEEPAIAFGVEMLSAFDERVLSADLDAVLASLIGSAGEAQTPVVCARLLTLPERQHVLVIAAPAACVDMETLRLLVAEIAQAYAGAESSADPVQYADYAEWQRQELQSSDEAAVSGRAFWTDTIRQWKPPVLPCAASIASSDRFQYQFVDRSIAVDDWQRLADLSRRTGQPIDRLCLAVWQTLLARVAATEQVHIRVASAGRSQADLSTAFGLYSRMLPLAIAVPSEDTFHDVLARSARALTESIALEMSWQCEPDAPFEVDFDWQLRESLHEGGVQWTIGRRVHHGSRFGMKLSCIGSTDGLDIRLSYDSNTIAPADAERLSEQFAALLKSAGEAPSRPIGELGLANQDAAPSIATGTSAAAPAPDVPSWIMAQARTTPHLTAVVGADAIFTYDELMTRATDVAAWLRAAGVAPGSVVGVCGERSAALMVGVLGVWFAGAAYLPIGVDQPPARVADQLQETSAAAVIVRRSSDNTVVCDFTGPVLNLSEGFRATAAPHPVHVDPESAAYVLYTSGSTGRPKGVVVRHRNLLAYTASVVATLRAAGIGGEGTRWATVSALTADLGNTCVFPALVSGGCLHVVPADTLLDGAALGEYLTDARVDVLKITPSHLAAILAETPKVLPRRALIFGGDALSWALVTQVHEQGTCAVWNHYGPTETTVGALMYPVPASSGRTRTVPIGQPLGAATVAVVDAAGAVVPVGVPGELWIGGAGVSAGYVGQPLLTAERFVTPGWGSGVMYRTGDGVWMASDHTVEFLGRVDDQVKIRGYRVEPGEVEHVLRSVPGVREGAVVVAGEVADLRLVAYVVADASTTDEAIKTALSTRLPDYMVPGTIARIGALPRLANGKVDRQQLAAADRHASTRDDSGPRTPVEEALCDMWQRLLSLPTVGIHDQFFDVGGHSLLATRLVAQIRRAFDVQLPLRAVFEHPTVSALANVIAERVAEQSQSADKLLSDVENLSDSEVQALLDQLDAK